MTTQTTTLNRIIEELRDLNEFDGETVEYILAELGYDEYALRHWMLKASKNYIQEILEEREELERMTYKPLLKWRYTVSTGRLWASFDEGEVEAYDYDEALEKSITKLRSDFDKANKALEGAGFTIDFLKSDVEVESI